MNQKTDQSKKLPIGLYTLYLTVPIALCLTGLFIHLLLDIWVNSSVIWTEKNPMILLLEIVTLVVLLMIELISLVFLLKNTESRKK